MDDAIARVKLVVSSTFSTHQGASDLMTQDKLTIDGKPLSGLSDHPLMEIPPIRNLAMEGKILGIIFLEQYIGIQFTAGVNVIETAQEIANFVAPSLTIVPVMEDRSIRIVNTETLEKLN